MIVYGSSVSPFVRKVTAFAAEKGVAVELKPVQFRSEDPEFRAASPFGRIPGFRDGDFHIADSSAICTYIEAKHPEPALMGVTPEEKARIVWFDEVADTIFLGAALPIFFNRLIGPALGLPHDKDAADAAEQRDLPVALDYLETVAPEGEGFLVGDRLTLADIAVAAPFGNLDFLQLDTSRWPRITAFAKRILARPSFAEQLAKDGQFMAGLRARLAA